MARPPSDIRARLIGSARERFLREGVDGASLRDIAKDTKTSLGIVVYWFPKKDDLFLAVVEEAYGPFLADVVACLEREGSARERLRDVMLRIADASTREMDVVRLIVREAVGSTTRRRRILRRFLRGHIPALLGVLEEAAKNGEIDAGIPVPVALIAFIGLGGLPQVVRRMTGPLGALVLPGKKLLAEWSIALFFRAMRDAEGDAE